MVVRAYHAGILQCLSYLDILNGLFFDNTDEEAEFEKRLLKLRRYIIL